MKLAILTFLLPILASAAGENLITCQLQNFEDCKNCQKRIPASCEDNAFKGALEVKMKPKKIQWLISDPKTGTERIITVDNKNLTLKDLITSKSLKALSAKEKIKSKPEETVTVIAVFFGEKTALYKDQSGPQIATLMKKVHQARFMASANSPSIGGIKRAQKMKEQK